MRKLLAVAVLALASFAVTAASADPPPRSKWRNARVSSAPENDNARDYTIGIIGSWDALFREVGLYQFFVRERQPSAWRHAGSRGSQRPSTKD